jgi:uncharacterized protein YjbJ (UPF0337 family)
MNKEQIEGAAQKAMGSAKETAGKAVGNEKLQAKGIGDKAAGAAKQAFGDAKDTVHKASR